MVGDAELIGPAIVIHAASGRHFRTEAMRRRVVDRNLMFVVLREQSGNIIPIPNSLFFQKMFRIGGHEDHPRFFCRSNPGGFRPTKTPTDFP